MSPASYRTAPPRVVETTLLRGRRPHQTDESSALRALGRVRCCVAGLRTRGRGGLLGWRSIRVLVRSRGLVRQGSAGLLHQPLHLFDLVAVRREVVLGECCLSFLIGLLGLGEQLVGGRGAGAWPSRRGDR